MKKTKWTIAEIVDQLELCRYVDELGHHKIENNTAFIALKEMAESPWRPISEIVDVKDEASVMVRDDNLRHLDRRASA